MWPGLLSLFETRLGALAPIPRNSSEKVECIQWQHLLYIILVALELVDDKDAQIVEREQHDEAGQLITTTYHFQHEGESIQISNAVQMLLLLNDLFGIKNIGIPKSITADEIGIIGSALKAAAKEAVPLAEMETHIETWIADNLDDQWNVYIELAEEGEFSVETIKMLQMLQRRLTALGGKTFRGERAAQPSSLALNPSADVTNSGGHAAQPSSLAHTPPAKNDESSDNNVKESSSEETTTAAHVDTPAPAPAPVEAPAPAPAVIRMSKRTRRIKRSSNMN